MRCLFLNSHYIDFMNHHYEKHSSLENAPYSEQKASLNATFFGDGDLYTEGIKAAGWEADELIINCVQLQSTWARENGYNGDDIMFEQIRRYAPDVVYTQGIWAISHETKKELGHCVKLFVAQTAMRMNTFGRSQYDAVFTAVPQYVDKFREAGVNAFYLGLAFDPRVLEIVGPRERDYPVTFVGSISGNHEMRRKVIERLAAIGIDCWGPGDYGLGNSHNGSAWGLDMFEILCRSRITVNCHIDFVKPYGGNMRLYEGTGCGALMVTDDLANLGELFELGKEVVAYDSPEGCLNAVSHYMDHPDEAAEIAKRGQERTLRDHTYIKRMEYVAGILEGML